MKQQTVEVGKGVSAGLKFGFSVPESIDEYTKAADRGPNAILDDALNTNIYRTGLPDAWWLLAQALHKQYGTKKVQKPHPNEERAKKGDTVDNESDPAYVSRVMAEQNLSVAAVQSLIDGGTLKTVNDALDEDKRVGFDQNGIILDLSERRSAGGGSLVGKGDLDMAATFLDAGPEKCSAALDKIAKALGQPKVELTGEREADKRAVALAIKAYRAQAAKSLIG